MIEAVLPDAVVSAEAFADPPDATLFTEEEALLARAVEKRRREFTTARHCARQALAELGVAPAPILPGLRGAPQWPDGIVGSMTHCAGYRAAAVARSSAVATVGIDAEPHDQLPDGVLRAIARGPEEAHLRDLAVRRPGTHWDRLLFCAKEATYKAWFPLMQEWLGFEDAEVTIDPDARTFTSRLLVDGPVVAGRRLDGFAGRFTATPDHLATAIAVPATPAPLAGAGPA